MDQDNKDYILYENGLKLPLIEQFYTIQGEGRHTGKPAYFIRIGGCDIGCHWCDTKISWLSDVHQLVDIESIVQQAAQTPAHAVVVTGGEPSRYNLDPLTQKLKENGIQTFLETSGAYKLTGIWDWICLSPKKNRPPDSQFYSSANELKVIIYEAEDFLWAENEASKIGEGCLLYLQPEWSRQPKILMEIVDYVKNNPKWNISIQAHKFMKIP